MRVPTCFEAIQNLSQHNSITEGFQKCLQTRCPCLKIMSSRSETIIRHSERDPSGAIRSKSRCPPSPLLLPRPRCNRRDSPRQLRQKAVRAPHMCSIPSRSAINTRHWSPDSRGANKALVGGSLVPAAHPLCNGSPTAAETEADSTHSPRLTRGCTETAWMHCIRLCVQSRVIWL
jgi:hypothetical protein